MARLCYGETTTITGEPHYTAIKDTKGRICRSALTTRDSCSKTPARCLQGGAATDYITHNCVAGQRPPPPLSRTPRTTYVAHCRRNHRYDLQGTQTWAVFRLLVGMHRQSSPRGRVSYSDKASPSPAPNMCADHERELLKDAARLESIKQAGSIAA